MDPAERYDEFIAGLAAERPRLHVAQMVRIRGLAAAHQARLLGHEPQVLPVAIAARLGQREHALVDAFGPVSSALSGRLGYDRFFGGSGRSDLR